MKKIIFILIILTANNVIITEQNSKFFSEIEEILPAKEVFKSLYKLKDKKRLIIYATHNRFFANMADCKLEIVDGNIKTINARIK